MCFLPQDRRFLSHALALAAEAAAFASPNPAVGCVITSNDISIGEGAHRYDARDHAEIVALKQAADNHQSTQGATAYVTLEPCSHHGRTGPCCEALIEARIARCVVATVDPNPRVSGSGIARMRAAGINVCVLSPSNDELAQHARCMNDAFAFSPSSMVVRSSRLKAALSVDGRLAPPASRTRRDRAALAHGRSRPSRRAANAPSPRMRFSPASVPCLRTTHRLPTAAGLARRRRFVASRARQPLAYADSTPLSSAPPPEDLLLFCASDASTEAETAHSAMQVLRVHRSADSTIHLDAVLDRVGTTRHPQPPAGRRRSHQRELSLAKASSTSSFSTTPKPSWAAKRSPSRRVRPHRTRCSSASRRRSAGPFRNGAAEDIRVTGYLHDPWANVACD